jgi:hypothetical protein
MRPFTKWDGLFSPDDDASSDPSANVKHVVTI